MAYLSEKGLLPCPFCGGPARTFQYNGTAQASCAALHTECAGTDIVAPVAMWNRRALSAVALPDELEGLLLNLEDEASFFDRAYAPDCATSKTLRGAATALSQAHSTIAALRSEIGELEDELEEARVGRWRVGNK